LSAKTLARVEMAVAVDVLEDEDAVLCLSSGTRLGYEYASATHSRPRSSIANAIGWTTSGSPANSVTLNPGGTVITFAASSGGSPAWA